ncbi:MAG: peptidoglycan DD-metalloendopeptidase family protein [Brevinematia bacterium]
MSIRNELYLINSKLKKQRKTYHKSNAIKQLVSLTPILLSMILLSISIYNIAKSIYIKTYSIEKLIVPITENIIPQPSYPLEIREYKVQKGDTIYSIYKKLNTTLSTIVSLNDLKSSIITPGKTILYTEDDVIKLKLNKKTDVYEIAKIYKKDPYEIFIANGYNFYLENYCLIPGVQLSWNEIIDRLGVGFAKPLIGRITSNFGYRKHPILGYVRFHSGVDISAPYGTEVKSVMSGIVEKVGYDEEGYGLYIVIKHHSKLKTLYGHLSKVLVKPKQKVSRGQRIGKVGTTGLTTGPHLHFEIIKNNQKVNPRKYLKRL